MPVTINGPNSSVDDSTGNELLAFGSVASAVNQVKITNAATGIPPKIEGDGETNVDLLFQGRGTGRLVTPAGVPGTTTTNSKIGGSLHANGTAVGNVGAGEDTLMSYTLPANVLGTNLDRVEIVAWGDFAANANSKRIRFKFGATTILDTTALAINNNSWRLQATIIRTGATAQLANAAIWSGDALLYSKTGNASPAETLSGTVAVAFTGEATADNDVRQLGLTVRWEPA